MAKATNPSNSTARAMKATATAPFCRPMPGFDAVFMIPPGSRSFGQLLGRSAANDPHVEDGHWWRRLREGLVIQVDGIAGSLPLKPVNKTPLVAHRGHGIASLLGFQGHRGVAESGIDLRRCFTSSTTAQARDQCEQLE